MFLGQWEDVEQNLKELDMLTVQLEDLVQERTILKSKKNFANGNGLRVSFQFAILIPA